MRIVLLLILFGWGLSQEIPYLCWENIWGLNENAEAYGIVTQADGNMVVCGDSDISPWAMKINPDGEILWERSIGQGNGHFRDIIKTIDGKFAAVGYSSSETGYSSDFWIVKLNQFGDIEWQSFYDLGSTDYGRSIKQTTDGGYIIGGYSIVNNEDKFALVKVDSNGMLEWSQIFEDETGMRAWSVLVHENGSYTLAGYSRVDNSYAGYLINVDTEGLVNWETSILGPNDETVQIYDAALNSLGQIVFAGRLDGYAGCIGIISSEGVLINIENVRESTGWSGRLSDIKILENSNIFVAGAYIAVLFSEDLEPIWIESVNYGSGTWAVECDNEGSYYGVGSGYISNEGYFSFVFKLTDIESPESVIINEIMPDPATVSDNNGEWFEVYNPTMRAINMAGWSLNDNSGESITLNAAAVINPHAYYILGKNSIPETNGGVYVDFQYTDFFLNNSSDAIIIKNQAGVTIDSVSWNANQPLPSQSGISAALTHWSFDNGLVENWEPSIDPYGNGDLGSPGGPNHFPTLETATEIFFSNTMIGFADTVVIHLANTGDDTLIITNILSLNESILPLLTEQSVSPGDTGIVPIVFIPQSEGSVESELWLFSNSYQLPGYAIGVSANAIAPGAEISLTSDTLQFIIDGVDSLISKYIHIQNIGVLPLTISNCEIFNSFNSFSIGTFPQVIEAGIEDSILVQLDVNSTTVEEFAELIIESNDLITPSATIILNVVNTATRVEQYSLHPDQYQLDQNYPNPFNPTTTIRYGLPEAAQVTLYIYDIKGRKVRSIIAEDQTAGSYEYLWNGMDDSGQPVSTGLYLTRMRAGSYSKTIKMLYLK